MISIFKDGKFSLSGNKSCFNHKILYSIVMILIIIINYINCHENNEEEIIETINQKTITCGSTLRISNVMTKFKYINIKLKILINLFIILLNLKKYSNFYN